MEPEEKDLRIYRFCTPLDDAHIPPLALNFKTGLTQRLHPKRLMNRGEVYRIEYYSTSTPTAEGPTYSNLVLSEDIVYLRDAQGNAITQTKTISWIGEDGLASTTNKVLEKVYTPDESIREGLRRRSNIIDYIKGSTIGLLMKTELPKGTTAEEVMDMGRQFIGDEETNIMHFIDAGLPTVHASVASDTTHLWLDNVIDPDGTTIRDFFLDELNIWGL